ncbi:hypothetical protein T484DRAFT_1758438 [Baffinella frigidus]|nr:hypothetical protein T484DRAFT_1758438 [Cryptophyta sp. CCMP2293]
MELLKEAFDALKRPMSDMSEVNPGDPAFDQCLDLLKRFDDQYHKLVDEIKSNEEKAREREQEREREQRRVIDTSGFDMNELRTLLVENCDIDLLPPSFIEGLIAEGKVAKVIKYYADMYGEVYGPYGEGSRGAGFEGRQENVHDRIAFDKLIYLLKKFEIETERQMQQHGQNVKRIVNRVMDEIETASQV